jgi:hypothetical protein
MIVFLGRLEYTKLAKEEFEDTKGVIKIRKSKDRQHNGQTKKDKMTNYDLQRTT